VLTWELEIEINNQDFTNVFKGFFIVQGSEPWRAEGQIQ
jgi:hypothetical protein